MSQANLETVVANASVNPTQAPKFAGKYTSAEELERGYIHQQTETNKIIAQRDDLARKAAILEAMVKTGGEGDRVMPADRMNARARSHVDVLAEALNADANLIRNALGEVANDAFAPVVGVMQAQAKVNAELPEFGREQPEVAQFLAANPEVNAEYSEMLRNPATAAAALKYAWFNMALARERAGLASARPEVQADMSGYTQATNRLDAFVPGSGASGRGAALAAQEAANMEAALAKGRAVGGADGWADYLVGALGDLAQGH